MDIEQAFYETRTNARNGYGYAELPRESRGWRIGAIDEHLKGAAAAAGLSFNGQMRKARLLLASDIFQRKINSYNNLNDDELIALELFTRGHGSELKTWMNKTFGKQLSFGTFDQTSTREDTSPPF